MGKLIVAVVVALAVSVPVYAQMAGRDVPYVGPSDAERAHYLELLRIASQPLIPLTPWWWSTPLVVVPPSPWWTWHTWRTYEVPNSITITPEPTPTRPATGWPVDVCIPTTLAPCR